MTTAEAHRSLLVLGVELLFVLGLATVAENSGGGGPIVVLLFVLLWGVLLVGHSAQLQQALGGLP